MASLLLLSRVTDRFRKRRAVDEGFVLIIVAERLLENERTGLMRAEESIMMGQSDASSDPRLTLAARYYFGI